MTMIFYWNPAAPTSLAAELTRNEVMAVFDAEQVRHLASAAGGDTWLIERRGTKSVVKIPTSDYQPSWVEREIKSLERGACANLVHVKGFEQITFRLGKRIVITFEYVEGLVLDVAIRTNQWPSSDQVRELVRGVLSGLDALHARETVHRDIKPANLILRDGDWARPVILDLGLARLLDEKGITHYPVAVGTTEFMAPEVIRRARAQKPADLWSLGVVTYILLTRSHPFYGGYEERVDEEEALERIETSQPPLDDYVPVDLRILVRRWLSVNPTDRGTAQDAIACLNPASGRIDDA